MIKKQFTLYLRNRPGALARVARALARADVNIEGISVAAGVDVALVQVVVSKAAKARAALAAAGIPVTAQSVSVLTLPNVPGSLAKAAARLAKAGVNLQYIYATTRGRECSVVVSASDLRKVEELWSPE